jgi:MerR family transcriptional regulator, light-induced transcriptional regulator
MEQELLTVAAVARRLGVAPATLRTWDRRYGLGPSGHQAGEHRRYRPSDLAKLTMMRRLITSGVSPSEAAELAKAHKGPIKIEKLVEGFEIREELVESLHRAAKSLDQSFIESLLRKDIAESGVIASWTEVIVPLLFLVGDDWESDGSGIEVEHMLSEILKKTLLETADAISTPINARPVLLASVGEELHCLALYALRAALAEKQIETFFLGARTPLEAISGMVKRSAPPAVFLWAQLEQNSHPKFFKELPAVRPAPRVIVGGPGWNRETCEDVVVAQDLTHACDEIERAVGL